jgi:hypothetical protein
MYVIKRKEEKKMTNQTANYYLENAFAGVWYGEAMKNAYTPILECIEKEFCGKFFRCKEIAKKTGCSVSKISHLIHSLEDVKGVKIEKLVESQNIAFNMKMPIDGDGNPKYIFKKTPSGDCMKTINPYFDWCTNWKWGAVLSWKTVEVVSYKVTFAD